jgi:hypothetical protein
LYERFIAKIIEDGAANNAADFILEGLAFTAALAPHLDHPNHRQQSQQGDEIVEDEFWEGGLEHGADSFSEHRNGGMMPPLLEIFSRKLNSIKG